MIINQEGNEYARKMELTDLEDQIDENIPLINFPNRNGLLLNALISCLEDEKYGHCFLIDFFMFLIKAS